MKKKIVALLLVAAMAAALGACGKDETKQSSAGTEAAQSDTGSSAGTIEFETSKVEYNVADYVTLGDYSNLSVEVSSEYNVTDTDVRTYTESLLAANPAYIDSDKSTVEDGDTVKIDFVGKIDGEEFDGGSAEDYALSIGSGTFIDGFEDGLVGATVGESLSLDLAFPEEYSVNPDLAGKPVTFDVTINKIVTTQEVAYDDMTDEYVKEKFDIDTVDAFLEQVKASLESSAESSKQSAVQDAVMEKLTEICEVTIPDELLEARVADYKVMFENFCQKNYSMSSEEFVTQNQNETIEEYYAEIVTDLEESISQELILEAIAEKEGLNIDESEYQKFVSSFMSYYGYDDETDFYDSNGGEDYVRKSYRENLALTKVCDTVQVSYTESGDAAADDGTAADDTAADDDAAQE